MDQRSHIVETEPLADTFGPKAQRKRPRIDVGSFEEFGKAGAAALEHAEEKSNGVINSEGRPAFHDPIHYLILFFRNDTDRRGYASDSRKSH